MVREVDIWVAVLAHNMVTYKWAVYVTRCKAVIMGWRRAQPGLRLAVSLCVLYHNLHPHVSGEMWAAAHNVVAARTTCFTHKVAPD